MSSTATALNRSAVNRSAVIVDAVRTPLGRRNGKLKDVHPVDLAAHALRALVERNDIDPALVEDVIMGCVMQVGEQGVNVGRNAALAAGFPESAVGTTDRPPVRLVAAGRALRRAGRDRRRVRRRDRGRRREHDAACRWARRSLPGQLPVRARDARALPEPRAAGHLGRADRREVGHQPRGERRVLGRVAPARRAARPRRAASTARSCRSTVTTDDGAETMTHRRGHPPRLVDRDARQAEARVQARRRDHRRRTRRRSPTARPRCSS